MGQSSVEPSSYPLVLKVMHFPLVLFKELVLNYIFVVRAQQTKNRKMTGLVLEEIHV